MSHGYFACLKYRYLILPKLFLFFLISSFFASPNSHAQIPHIDESRLKEGLLELKFADSWRYHPGDDLQWVDPDFDDSHWHVLNPIGLKAYRTPDSLWIGYGWWRLTFTATPETVEAIERLYFISWGAAEVYLNGELVAKYGKFSTHRRLEKTHTPNYEGDRTLKIVPNETYTLAVRFSHHQAKDNFKIFRYFSENLGFNIGFDLNAQGL